MPISFNADLLKEKIGEFYKAYTALSEKNPDKDYFTDLKNAWKSLELIKTIDNLNAISIAGMQGTGKTTLIETLYELPPNILPTNQARGEAVPIIIRESSELPDNQPAAKRCFFDMESGKIMPTESVPVEEIGTLSKKGANTVYLELTLPQKYFDDSSSAFIVLPGLEKADEETFDESYNRFIYCCLKWSKAVVFVTDDQNIANDDINKLVEMLRSFRFDEKNSVFAITKCDRYTASKPDYEKEITVSLLNRLGVNDGKSNPYKIVCCGKYPDQGKNELWIEALGDAINSITNVSKYETMMTFYKPIVDNVLHAINEIDRDLNEAYTDIKYDESPIRGQLEKELTKSGEALTAVLDSAVNCAREEVDKKIEDYCSSGEFARLTDNKKKTWFFGLKIKKNNSELNSDRRTVLDGLNKCFSDKDGNIFQREVIDRFYNHKFGAWEFPCLEDGVEDILLLSEGEGKEIQKTEKDLISNPEEVKKTGKELVKKYETISFYLTEHVETLPDDAPDKVQTAALVNQAFNSFFISSYSNAYNADIMPKLEGFIGKTPREVKRALKNSDGKTIGKVGSSAALMVDMIDGKPDILITLGSAAGKAIEMAAPLLSTPAGIAVAAVSAVCAVGAAALTARGNRIDFVQANLNSAKIQAYNALCKQRELIMKEYEKGCYKLLDTVDAVKRNRDGIGDKETRIIKARVAVVDVRNICQSYIDEINK